MSDLLTDMCDFENGECYFTQTVPDQFDWVVVQANSRAAAPTIDNTYRSSAGTYIRS